LFLILWLAGLAGVLSFQLVDLQALIAMLPATQGKPLPLPMAVIRLLSIVQGAVLVAVAAFAGLLLASRVGLSAPASQALAERRPFLPALRPQLLPGVFGAAIAAPAILGGLFYGSRSCLLRLCKVQKSSTACCLLQPGFFTVGLLRKCSSAGVS
jgi:hypothetical protein